MESMNVQTCYFQHSAEAIAHSKAIGLIDNTNRSPDGSEKPLTLKCILPKRESDQRKLLPLVKKHFGESLQRTAGLAAHKNHAFSISS
jgi:hypothetical protein